MSVPTLFLDFDGVLHEVDVANSPLLTFHRAGALAATLKGLNVRIVLSTSWVSVYG